MGRTRRNRNLDLNSRTLELHAAIKKDKRRNLAYIPLGFLFRTDAMRLYNLSESDLEQINYLAMFGVKNGQEGIFYPIDSVQALDLEKKEETEITDDMISEGIIFRQIPKSDKDPSTVVEFRKLGVKGTRLGHKGKDTHFYSVTAIESYLGLKVIVPESVEGEDFIKAKNVPSEIQRQLPEPMTAIWAAGAAGMAEKCYFPPQVTEILSSGLLGLPVLRRSNRSALHQEVTIEETGSDPSLDLEHFILTDHHLASPHQPQDVPGGGAGEEQGPRPSAVFVDRASPRSDVFGDLSF